MEDNERIRALAGEAYYWFQTIKRGDENIVTLKDDHPAWVQSIVFEAHGKDASGSPLFFPDDWRYRCIRCALGSIHDNDGDLDDLAHSFADAAVNVYTGSRLKWLASNLIRAGYVDDAVAELGGGELDTTERIGLGQYAEAREVFGEVLSKLQELVGEEL